MFHFFDLFEPQKKESINSVVYVDKPISDAEKDLIGVKAQVKSIETAIKDGARIIGIVGDYGTGKSSLASMLGDEDDTKIISLWDCIKDNKASGENDKIDGIPVIIKSFLYQLACGNDDNGMLSNYVNKLLSKNYGKLSIDFINKQQCILLTCLFLIFIAIEFGFVNNLSDIIFNLFGIDQNIVTPIVNISLIIVGIIILFILISQWSSVLFSSKTSQGVITPEINEVFEAYRVVINQITNKNKNKNKNKNTKIIVEDMDRILNHNVAISFLKEIYRFNNLLDKDIKGKIVYIIPIKPEVTLFDPDCGKLVYNKIFDYVINLNPIHNDDCKNIVLELINNKLSEINKLTKKVYSDTELHDDFIWIAKGKNLTIRDIKQRLNNGFLLYSSLKLKHEEKGGDNVKLKTCMAVSYLESAYPKEYYKLIDDEENFRNIVIAACKYVCDKKTDEFNEEFLRRLIKSDINDVYIFGNNPTSSLGENVLEEEGYDIINKNFLLNYYYGFVKDLFILLCDEIINNDYRMYFYSYPKGSIIKNAYDIRLSDLLEKEEKIKVDDNIDELVKNSSGKLIKYSINNRISYGLPLRPVILKHIKLFNIAYEINENLVIQLMLEELKWDNSVLVDDAKNILKKINSYLVDDKENIVGEAIDYNNKINFKKDVFGRYSKELIEKIILIKQDSQSNIDNRIIEIRNHIMDTVGNDMANFRYLYDNDGVIGFNSDGEQANIPVISPIEIDNQNVTYEIKLQLIDWKKVDFSTIGNDKKVIIKYISEFINKQPTREPYYKNIEDGYLDLINNNFNQSLKEELANYVLGFLKVNKKVNIDLFNYIIKNLKKEDYSIIVAYLNDLDIDIIPSEYYLSIKDIAFEGEFSSELLKRLLENNCYLTYLLNENIDEIEYEVIFNNIIECVSTIMKINKDRFIELRGKMILSKKLITEENCKKLFLTPYSIITLMELLSIKNTVKCFEYIDYGRLDINNCNLIYDFINERKLVSSLENECFIDLFINNRITDSQIINSIFTNIQEYSTALEKVDKNKLNTLISRISNACGLSNSKNIYEFMDKYDILIPILEKTLVSTEGLNEKYISLINRLNKYTDATINNLRNHNLKYKLNEIFTNKLYEEGLYKKYIIGKTLKDERLVFDKNIEFKYYGDLLSSDIIIDYMVRSKCFLDHIIRYNYYEGKSEKILLPLGNRKQTIGSFKYILDHISDKENFIKECGKFRSKNDNDKIANLFTNPEYNYIKLLCDEDVFNAFYEKLWDTSLEVKENVKTAREEYLKSLETN